jgi:hypothetical protein
VDNISPTKSHDPRQTRQASEFIPGSRNPNQLCAQLGNSPIPSCTRIERDDRLLESSPRQRFRDEQQLPFGTAANQLTDDMQDLWHWARRQLTMFRVGPFTDCFTPQYQGVSIR